MFFTGYLSSTGSYFLSLPWSGGALWPLLRPTPKIFVIPPWAPEVAVPSDQWNGGLLFVSFARILQLARLVHYRWWTPLLALQLLPRVHSDTTLALKLLFLAVLELGALLSSNFAV